MSQSTLSATRLAALVGSFDRSPAYAGLADALRELIGDGRIGYGTRLPSERDLTDALGVSRTTVTRAYAMLRDTSYAEARRGAGTFTRLPGGRTEVVLEHDFTAVDDDADALEWITRAVDRNSPVELAALARIAEQDHPVDDLVFSFSDVVRLPGTAADAYAFVHRSDAWPDRLPHVRRVVLREDEPGVQLMEMDTVTADGSTHTTESVRLCFEPSSIVYKQSVPPKLLFGHSGSWAFEDTADGVVVTARHTVAINPDAVPEVLGEGRTVADAAAYLREALGRNSRATLSHAGAHAEARHPSS